MFSTLCLFHSQLESRLSIALSQQTEEQSARSDLRAHVTDMESALQCTYIEFLTHVKETRYM